MKEKESIKKRLTSCIRNGDVQQLRKLLMAEVTQELLLQPVVNSLQWNCIHLVVSSGFNFILDVLLAYHPRSNQPDRYGWTAAHLAIVKGDYYALVSLITRGSISVNALTHMQESLVFLAAEYNQTKILIYLIANQASLTIKTTYQQTPLSIALKKGHLSCVMLLLQKQQQLNQLGQQYLISVMQQAIDAEQIAVISYLVVHHKLDLPNVGQLTKNTEIKYFIQLFSPVIADFFQFSNYLSKLNNCDAAVSIIVMLVKYLVEKQNEQSVTPLLDLIAKQYDQSLVAETLFTYYPQYALQLNWVRLLKTITVDGKALPLSVLAIKQDNKEQLIDLARLHRENTLLMVSDELGNSLAHYCARYDAVVVLQYLVDCYRASLQVNNKLGESIAHYAVRYRANKVLTYLVKQPNVDLNSSDNKGNTPLHIAVLYNDSKGIEILLEKFVDREKINQEQKTPLQLAQIQENKYLISLLTMPLINDERVNSLLVPKIAVFQGGGVKGLGFLGALRGMEAEKMFDIVKLRIAAGTSAGAISAFLLACGYSLEGLEEIMRGLNFSDLLDPELREPFFKLKEQLAKPNGMEDFLGKTTYKLIMNAKNGELSKDYIVQLITDGVKKEVAWGMFGSNDNDYTRLTNEFFVLKEKLLPFLTQIKNHQGLFSGEILREKFCQWLNEQKLDENLTFGELHEKSLGDSKYKDLFVAVYNSSERKTEVVSYLTHPNHIIAYAVRCSMSIQLFFYPARLYVKENGLIREDDRKCWYFDGGSLDNYMLDYFNCLRFTELDNHDSLWLLNEGMQRITNVNLLGFKLTTPQQYDYYENSIPLPKSIDQQSTMDFLLTLVASLNTFTKQDSDYSLRSDLIRQTIHINTLDIDTVEFDINEERKQKLIDSGKQGAAAFIQRFKKHPFINIKKTSITYQLRDLSNHKLFKQLKCLSVVLSITELANLLKNINRNIYSIKEDNGDTLCHYAIRQGDVKLLAKLYQLHGAWEITNKQGQQPLDCLVECSSMMHREQIVDFFVERNVWPVVLIVKNWQEFDQNNVLIKKDYLLRFAYQEQTKNSHIDNKSLFFVENFLKNNSYKALKKNYRNDLVLFIVCCIENKEYEELDKLPITLKNTDSLDATYCFVFQANNAAVKYCLEQDIVFNNKVYKNGNTLLDCSLTIESYSKQDTKLQQQTMVKNLIQHGCFRCSFATKQSIAELIQEDSEFQKQKCWLSFQEYDQLSDWKKEYQEFKKAHILAKIKIQKTFALPHESNKPKLKNLVDVNIKGLKNFLKQNEIEDFAWLLDKLPNAINTSNTEKLEDLFQGLWDKVDHQCESEEAIMNSLKNRIDNIASAVKNYTFNPIVEEKDSNVLN